MHDLLGHYSIQETLVFLVFLAVALKECVSFFDWASARLKQEYLKTSDKDLKDDKQNGLLSKHEKAIQDLEERDAYMTQMLNLLIDSNKNSIKAWLTEKYHFFMKQGFIDEYSLDCLERRFANYKESGGNSFVETLMNKIRNLPVVSHTEDDKEDTK